MYNSRTSKAQLIEILVKVGGYHPDLAAAEFEGCTKAELKLQIDHITRGHFQDMLEGWETAQQEQEMAEAHAEMQLHAAMRAAGLSPEEL